MPHCRDDVVNSKSQKKLPSVAGSLRYSKEVDADFTIAQAVNFNCEKCYRG